MVRSTARVVWSVRGMVPARYDVATGRMARGPQGVFAKIPGSDTGYRLLTRVLPLGRGVVVEREGTVFVRSQEPRKGR